MKKNTKKLSVVLCFALLFSFFYKSPVSMQTNSKTAMVMHKGTFSNESLKSEMVFNPVEEPTVTECVTEPNENDVLNEVLTHSSRKSQTTYLPNEGITTGSWDEGYTTAPQAYAHTTVNPWGEGYTTAPQAYAHTTVNPWGEEYTTAPQAHTSTTVAWSEGHTTESPTYAPITTVESPTTDEQPSEQPTTFDSSLKVERILIGTKTNYYGAANYESSKAGEVQDAAIEFKDKLVSYYNAFCSEGQKKIGNTNSLISLDDLAKQLRKQDESTSDKYITMIDSSVPSDCLDSVYYALADFLTNVVNNNVDLGSIDFSKDSITNAAKIINAVSNGMRRSDRNTIRKGNYEITIKAPGIGSSFAGTVTAKKVSGFNSGSTYTGEIDSTIAGTQKVLEKYMDCMSDIVKDACKYALFSILSEFKSVTGIAEFEKTQLENFLSDKVVFLQENGFGDVLGLFLNTRTGYKAVKPILNANTGSSLRTALNNAQRIYDAVNEMEFSTDGISWQKKAIKDAVKEVEKARKKLANKLFNYIYNTDEPLEEEGGFWDWIKNIFGIQCPVEFEVYDNNGNLIGYVDSSDKHEDYLWYTDDIYIEVDSDSKFVYAPVDMELNFVFTAIDDGTMDYTIERQNGRERINRLNYYDVPLTAGETFEQSIPANVNLNNHTELPLVGNDEINYDQYLGADNVNGHINVTCEAANGTVIGDGAYPVGDLVKLVALENDEYKFKGWSVNDSIVETSEIYRFTAKEDVLVKAVFEKKKDVDYSYTTAYSDDYSDSYIELIKQSDDTRSVYIAVPPNKINDVALTSIRLFNDADELTYSSQYDGVALSDCEIMISDLVFNNADRIEILDRNDKPIAILEKNDLTAQQIVLDKDDLTMDVNVSIQIYAFPIPVAAQLPDIRWESTNPEIATVDDTGIVTSVSPGKTTIKCFALDSENIVECEVIQGKELYSFVGHSISLNGDIGINFYVDVPDEEINNGNVKVDFAWTVEDVEKTHSVTLSSDDKYDLGYKASCPVAVAEMTYDVTATVTIDGVTQSIPDTYSAQKYAKVILNNENNFREKYIAAENGQGRNGEQRYNDLVTLIQTMLDYGTKAQVVFNRDTEHPANEGTDYFNDETYPVTSDMITATEENMDMDLSAYGLRYKGSTVVYLSETSIRHYYYVDDWDSFKKVKDSITFDGVSVGYTEKDGAIYFEKKGIGASDLDTPYTLTIKDKSCKFAVNDYIRHCLESTKVSDNTKALVKATYRYNVAANTYFEL